MCASTNTYPPRHTVRAHACHCPSGQPGRHPPRNSPPVLLHISPCNHWLLRGPSLAGQDPGLAQTPPVSGVISGGGVGCPLALTPGKGQGHSSCSPLSSEPLMVSIHSWPESRTRNGHVPRPLCPQPVRRRVCTGHQPTAPAWSD